MFVLAVCLTVPMQVTALMKLDSSCMCVYMMYEDAGMAKEPRLHCLTMVSPRPSVHDDSMVHFPQCMAELSSPRPPETALARCRPSTPTLTRTYCYAWHLDPEV